MNKRNQGITLIALVITIIILLILLGITINLVLGDNGVLNRAKNAGKNYIDAENEERNVLNTITDIMDEIVGKEGIDKEWSKAYEQTKLYIDSKGKTAMISKGFQVSLKEDKNTIENGLVIRNAQDLNEYVWIPVEDINQYIRYDFGKQYGNYSDYKETLSETEKNSVSVNKGFYLGRYEVGTDTKRTSPSDTITKAFIQKDKEVYNYVTRQQAITLAQGFSTQDVTTTICSSYSWDTALRVMYSFKGQYPENAEGKKEVIQKIGIHSFYNIYDMAGNLYEWSSEIGDSANPCVVRGGVIGYTTTETPASYRTHYTELDSRDYIGFRVMLYINAT